MTNLAPLVALWLVMEPAGEPQRWGVFEMCGPQGCAVYYLPDPMPPVECLLKMQRAYRLIGPVRRVWCSGRKPGRGDPSSQGRGNMNSNECRFDKFADGTWGITHRDDAGECVVKPERGMRAMQMFTRDSLPDQSQFTLHRKLALARMVRIAGPFLCKTREGELTCEDGYLALDSGGWPYPIAKVEYDAMYEPVLKGIET